MKETLYRPSNQEIKPTLRAQKLLSTAHDSIAYNKKQGKTLTEENLSRLFHHGYWIGLFGDGLDKRTEAIPDEKIQDTLRYVLTRFVDQKTLAILPQATIHFTDDPQEFYLRPRGDFLRSANRGRVYRVDRDDPNNPTITFLLRRSVPDVSTDSLELLSSLSFMGFAKKRIRQNPSAYKELAALFPDQDIFQQWTQSNLAISKGNWDLLPLSQVRKTAIEGRAVPSVYADFILKLQEEMSFHNVSFPERVLIGNDFSVPLMIASGVLSDMDIDFIFTYHQIKTNQPLYAFDEQADQAFNEEKKTMLKRFAALQYLNRYTGEDARMKRLKNRVHNCIHGFRKRLLNSTATGIGEPVDIIDFSKIDDNVIQQIPYTGIRKVIQTLKQKQITILQTPYPLGDSMYGFIQALHVLGMNQLGFFGKVGSVVKNGDRPNRGRVVLPEYVVQIGHPFSSAKRFDDKNGIAETDCLLVPAADRKEILVSNNSLLLQNPTELVYEENNEKILPLLDMEAWWMLQACQELQIPFYALYYISDNTVIGMPTTDNAITVSMGNQGTLAALETAATVLAKLAQT